MIRIDNDRLEIADGGPTQMPWTVTGAEEIVVPPSLTPHPLPAATRGRWLRRLAWTVALLMMLLLLVVICVQLVLWSDYPRRYVVAELEQQLGLRVEAEKLSTTWWGETHLKNVALSLPLGQDAFVRVPQMTVRHTSLIPLLLQRPLVIDALTLNDPALVVRQDRLGRWDIVEVAELLGRVAGGHRQLDRGLGPAQQQSPAHVAAVGTLSRRSD